MLGNSLLLASYKQAAVSATSQAAALEDGPGKPHPGRWPMWPPSALQHVLQQLVLAWPDAARLPAGSKLTCMFPHASPTPSLASLVSGRRRKKEVWHAASRPARAHSALLMPCAERAFNTNAAHPRLPVLHRAPQATPTPLTWAWRPRGRWWRRSWANPAMAAACLRTRS